MKKVTLLLFLFIFVKSSLFAEDVSLLAKEYNLQAGTKAIVQWKRIFSSERHLKRYKLLELDQKTREALQVYLIKHAADSEQPIVPGL